MARVFIHDPKHGFRTKGPEGWNKPSGKDSGTWIDEDAGLWGYKGIVPPFISHQWLGGDYHGKELDFAAPMLPGGFVEYQYNVDKPHTSKSLNIIDGLGSAPTSQSFTPENKETRTDNNADEDEKPPDKDRPSESDIKNAVPPGQERTKAEEAELQLEPENSSSMPEETLETPVKDTTDATVPLSKSKSEIFGEKNMEDFDEPNSDVPTPTGTPGTGGTLGTPGTPGTGGTPSTSGTSGTPGKAGGTSGTPGKAGGTSGTGGIPGKAGGKSPPPPPKSKENKYTIPFWSKQALAGKADESLGSDLSLIGRLIGTIMGGGARALGNIGAALDTTGSQQASVYGNPMAGASALTKGFGEFGGVTGDAIGETIGGILEDSHTAFGNWRQDLAAHWELEQLQDELYKRLHNYVADLYHQGVDINKAGVFDVLKNIANTMGNAFISNSRNRMVNANRRRRR
jgi:hypothetical protein